MMTMTTVMSMATMATLTDDFGVYCIVQIFLMPMMSMTALWIVALLSLWQPFCLVHDFFDECDIYTGLDVGDSHGVHDEPGGCENRNLRYVPDDIDVCCVYAGLDDRDFCHILDVAGTGKTLLASKPPIP